VSEAPSAYPSYKPDPVTAWMAVAGSGLIPRKATFEPPTLPADRTKRRLPRSRTRDATPISERASLLQIGEEQGVDGRHLLRCSPGQQTRSVPGARTQVAVRLADHRRLKRKLGW